MIAGSGAADAVVIVKNADGAPVKDALVQFTQSGTTSLNWASATESRTGADGKASVTFTQHLGRRHVCNGVRPGHRAVGDLLDRNPRRRAGDIHHHRVDARG